MKKPRAKATCSACRRRVRIDPTPLLRGESASVECPHCHETFTVSLMASGTRRAERPQPEPANLAETANLARPSARRQPEPAVLDAENDPDFEVDLEDEELPFKPLLEEKREPGRGRDSSANVPFAPQTGTPQPAARAAPSTQDLPAPEQKGELVKWLVMIVSIVAIGIVIFLVPLGDGDKPGQSGQPGQPGPEVQPPAPAEEELATLDAGLFDPPLPEWQPPVVATVDDRAFAHEVAYPLPSLPRWFP